MKIHIQMVKLRILFLFFIVLTACSSKKDIVYLQNIKMNEDYKIDFKEYKIDIDDILKIDIITDNPELSLQFNRNLALPNNNSTPETYKLNGFQVDSNGEINYPTIGNIYVKGLSINELINMIEKNISDNGLLVNPTVDIKIINASFTILGEVNKPGKYEFLNNNLSVLQAIGIAGDLTINGQRKDIKIIREKNGKATVNSIDLTKSNFLQSDYNQIFPGDIIVVNPNYNRIKNAGIIGNSGTLLSLLSFILSSIIVINSN